MRRRTLLMTGAAGAALLASGCASGPPPQPVLLALPVLGAAGAATTAPAPGRVPPVLLLRRLALPEALLTRRVRHRAGDTALEEWPGVVWAERIEVAMTRELASALRAGLPGWTVCETDCGREAPAVVLQVALAPLDFWRAEGRLRGQARARWTAPGGVERSLGWPVDVRAEGDSAAAQARAIGTMLEGLAASLAGAIGAARDGTADR